MWEGSDAEEEPLEMSEDETPAPPPAPPAPAASAPAPAGGDPEDPEDPEDPDDEDDDEDDQDDGPPEERAPYCVYTSFHEEGYFPLLLRDMLNELHNPVAPMYKTWHYEDPALGDYYITRVHIRVDNGPPRHDDRLRTRLLDTHGDLPCHSQPCRQEGSLVPQPH